METSHLGFNTRMVHAGQQKDAYGAAVTPIYQTSTFAFDNAQTGADRFAGRDEGFIYTRIGNPTIRALERNIASLENGGDAVATSSGMGAVTVIYMTLLSQGAHLVSTGSVYGPSRGLIEKQFSRFGVESSYVDTSDVENVRRALRPNTRLVYLESPSNPAMLVTDIRAVSDLAHAHGALVAVDNTFASPHLQQPLDLGADIVVHSVTKFINGHADVVGGILVAKDLALCQRLRAMMVVLGVNMDPHQAYLVSRGVKTLSLRVERAQQNAMVIARWLERHPKVAWVRYVGLESHPQHELVMRQMRGFGSMISFELKGGYEAGRNLMDNVRLATLAVSLGGVETLIEHPASMTHASLSQAHRLEGGITDGLVRYSVGIEDVEDLIADLDQAIGKVAED
jgi:methionine-gamma-lyase